MASISAGDRKCRNTTDSTAGAEGLVEGCIAPKERGAGEWLVWRFMAAG
jgi:hypothetical protein